MQLFKKQHEPNMRFNSIKSWQCLLGEASFLSGILLCDSDF